MTNPDHSTLGQRASLWLKGAVTIVTMLAVLWAVELVLQDVIPQPLSALEATEVPPSDPTEAAEAAAAEELARAAAEISENIWIGQRDADPDLALLLAIKALLRRPTRFTQQTLRNTLEQIGAGHVTLSHANRIATAVFSPDGQRILTASYDHTAQLWSTAGQPIITLRGHTNELSSAAFSPDGTRILTASYDGTVRLWDSAGQQLSFLRSLGGGVTWAAFSPDGQRILTSDHRDARLLDLHGRLLLSIPHQTLVKDATFSPDGQRIATADAGGTVHVWSIDGRHLAALEGRHASLESVRFSPDGQRILTGSDYGVTRLWSADGRLQATLGVGQGHSGRATFSPDGRRILVMQQQARIYLARIEDVLAVAVCRVRRDLTPEERRAYRIERPRLERAGQRCPPPGLP